VELEKRGIPAVAICTLPFERLVVSATHALRMPDLEVVFLPHPLADRSANQLDELVDEWLDRVAAGLTAGAASR
jgi:hypothetical protein